MSREVLAARLGRPDLAALLAALDTGGEEARLVGGAVRNALLGLPATDFDLVTTASPPEVIARVEACGWKAVPTGIEHGTVTVVIEGQPFEVTTLRSDIETDGRHAKVRFGRDFREDAARRDFTINALSADRTGGVHDYFGGIDDLAARRLRFIGDPSTRLREDYLRGLRFLRFSAQYAEGPLDAAGKAAVVAARSGYARLSGERVRQEMLKLLMAPRAAGVLAEIAPSGLLAEWLGATVVPGEPAAAIDRAARLGRPPPGAIARLAALIGDELPVVEAVADRLKLANRERDRLAALGRSARALSAGVPARELAYREPAALAEAVALVDLPGEAVRAALAAAASPPVFRLKGRDALARGVPAGEGVGRALSEAEARWIAADLPDPREAQLAILDAVLAG